MASRRKRKDRDATRSPDFDANQVTKRDIEYVATPEAEEPADEPEKPGQRDGDEPQGPDRPSQEPEVSEPGLERERRPGVRFAPPDGGEAASPSPSPDRHRHPEPTD